MLVKFIAKENEAYWLLLKDVPAPSQNQKSFTVQIPRVHRLSQIDWGQIQSYVRGVSGRKLAAQRKWKKDRWKLGVVASLETWVSVGGCRASQAA
jgi:hypothetical protein